jgi:hypothetical protein
LIFLLLTIKTRKIQAGVDLTLCRGLGIAAGFTTGFTLTAALAFGFGLSSAFGPRRFCSGFLRSANGFCETLN